MSDLQRDKFEVWAKEFGFPVSRYADGYYLPATNYAWQAAIESVVVEIPKTGIGYDDVFYMRGDAVTSALDKAGIKYE